MNLCFALGVGLLVWLGPSEQDRKQKYMVKPNALNEQREVLGTMFAVLGAAFPGRIVDAGGLALMLGATMFSLSRGGFVALFVALIVTMCLRLSWPIRVRRLEVLLVPALLLLGLFAWIGFRPLESRLATLMKISETTSDTRLSMWADLPQPGATVLARRIGLRNSGIRRTAYPGRATTFSDPGTFVEHAHNDYLEAFIEGGVLKGGLTVLLVGLIFMAGVRGLRRYSGGRRRIGRRRDDRLPGNRLAYAVDFSVTTPAVAIWRRLWLHSLSPERADPTRPPADDTVHMNSVRLAAVGRLESPSRPCFSALAGRPNLGIGSCVPLEVSSVSGHKKSDPPNREEAIRCLNAAAQIDPDDAELQSDSGQEYLDFGREELAIPQASHRGEAVQSFSRIHGTVAEYSRLARRDCPLLPRPQMRFAAHAAELSRADSPRQYWNRA